MKFWDASAIIPLCIEEPQTEAVMDIVKNDGAIVVWWGTVIECFSAISRLSRDGMMDSEGEEQFQDLLRLLSDSWSEIESSDDIRDIAVRLLRSNPLRAADSLQLASAVVWADKKPKGHHFVCFDLQLRDAARKEGFSLLPSRIS